MSYQIKLYDKAKVFKDTININIIKNKINFTKQTNGGLGQFSFLLDLKMTPNSGEYKHITPEGEVILYNFIQGDLIEIYNFDGGIQTLIYVGYIEEIINNITDFEELELKINGLASLLKRMIYNVAGNYSATINQDSFTTISDIITFVNASYNYFSIDSSLTGITTSFALNYTNCFDLINNITSLTTNYYWFLDNYTLKFLPKPTVASNTFTLAKDLIELDIEEDRTDLVNYLILAYNGGVAVYQDRTSISTYGKREKYENNSQIANLTSANLYGNKYILENKNPIQKIKLSVNNNYSFIYKTLLQDLTANLNTYTQDLQDFFINRNINTISPGESCKIRNINKIINDNLIISKITYNQDKITLDLEKSDNFISIIKQK